MNQTRSDQQYFVTRVNEIYHDVEGEAYLQRHPEIFVDEARRWRRIAKKYLVKHSPVIVLDIGTGTGFVPLTIAPFLKREDTVICSDISSVMLEICKREITKRQFECQFRFVKSRGGTISPVEISVDFITMNSVLHHIPNVAEFYSQIEAVLSEEGMLIIAHEPNKPFYENRLLWNNYVLLSRLSNLPATGSSILKELGLLSFVKSLLNRKPSQHGSGIVDSVNMHLLEEGLIEKPLTGVEISAIVDIHSPTAGGFHKERCLDFHQLLKDSLVNLELVHFETYNHCCKATSRNLLTKSYANFLSRVFPGKGATFLAVLKRKLKEASPIAKE